MGFVATVINNGKKYKLSTIATRHKFPITTGDKEADKILNFGDIDTIYECAINLGSVPLFRKLVVLIEYAELYQGEELTLEGFHKLVVSVVKTAKLGSNSTAQLEKAFEKAGMSVDTRSLRQLFMFFKKANILIVRY